MRNSFISDDLLIKALREGDKNALTNVVKKLWRAFYKEAFSKIKSHQVAEDIVLELFQELWDKRGSLLSGTCDFLQLKTYLDLQLKNKILQSLAHQSSIINKVSAWNLPTPRPAAEAIEYQLQKRIKFSH